MLRRLSLRLRKDTVTVIKHSLILGVVTIIGPSHEAVTEAEADIHREVRRVATRQVLKRRYKLAGEPMWQDIVKIK